MSAIETVVLNKKGEDIAQALLDDPRATDIGDLLAEILNEYEYQPEIGLIILKSKQIQLEDVDEDELYELVGDLDIGEVCNDYNKCHYKMLLLRELVVKQRDYIYYLDWLIDRMQRPTTRLEVRDLISGAATAVLTTEPTVHTSPQGAEARKRDVALILDTLRLDAGVTRDGIERAEKLLQALQLDSD